MTEVRLHALAAALDIDRRAITLAPCPLPTKERSHLESFTR
jgi:hypothetical protein